MKIGILSMQRVVNFGSVLQAWSLRQMIQEAAGVSAEFLDIENSPALESQGADMSGADGGEPAFYSRCVLQRGKRRIIRLLSSYNKRLIRRFMEKELRLDAACSQNMYDCVVVGSDEVFNHVAGIRLQLHGKVKQAQRVITYAASCGTAKPEDVRSEDAPELRAAMRRFEAVSVRDAGTERYAEHFYDGPIHRHLDPVLMGELHARKVRKVWLKKYMLVYAYGQRIRSAREIEAIRSFAKQRKLKIVAVGGSQYWCDLYLPLSPMSVLDWFAHADYVVTDTFHGVIFSVINQRPFAAIVRSSNENKLMGLLGDLALTARRFTDSNTLEEIFDEAIDYDRVNALLSRERVRTRAYLKEFLTHEKGNH